MPNKLNNETSLYLRQHAENPVDWHPWGPEALKLAKKLNKPILLSVGYAACHWCHVMAHESFEDPQTAELMNRFFVNIKVDREERPDIDALYQEALRLTGRHGGWPLTMFLTPEGRPFFGGTYFPPEVHHGMASFREVLWQVANLWRKDPDDALEKSKNLEEGMRKLATSQAGPGDMPQEKIDELALGLMAYVDPDNGGFGRQNKFPNVTALQLMWQTWRCGDDQHHTTAERRVLAAAVRLSLDHMCQGGMYDHLGGGFFRYTVEPTWLVPHFEKMLYDNALLVDLLTQVWKETKNPLYAARVHQTVGWLLREMPLEGGGFAASLDADNPEGEGAYYTWTAEQLKTLLGKEAQTFMAAYGASEQGNFEGANILNRLHDVHGGLDAETPFEKARSMLLKARQKRPTPARDGKCLADWNGLAIAALAEAAMAFNEPTWLDAAQTAYKGMLEKLLQENGTALHHSWCDGKPQQQSFVDDYAVAIHAALTLFEATADMGYLKQAESWALWTIQHYEDSLGGFFKNEKTNKDLFTPIKEGRDAAWPSANGLMLRNFARLYGLGGNVLWCEQGRRVFGAFAEDVKTYPFGATSLLMGQSQLVQGLQLVLVGSKTDKGFTEMLRAIHEAPQPNRMLLVTENPNTLGPLHAAFGKTKVDDKPTLYICLGTTCSGPVNKPAHVVEVLKAFSPLKAFGSLGSSSKTA